MTVVVCERPWGDWVWNQGGKCSELWHFCSSWTHKITTHSWCLLVALFWTFVVIASENILKKGDMYWYDAIFKVSYGPKKCQIFLGISFTKLYCTVGWPWISFPHILLKHIPTFFQMSKPIHPGRLTWNLQITRLERKMIFQTSMIMFHVNLPGCTVEKLDISLVPGGC